MPRAIAKRSKLTAPLTTALIKTDDEVCVLRVASNDNAELETGSMHRLLDRFAENPPVVEAVSQRSMLPLAIVERLTAVVGGKVLQKLIERYDIPAHRVSRLIQHGREHVLLTSFALDQSADEIRGLVERLADNRLLTTSLILRALCLGNFTFLLPALALQARIPSRNVRLLIADESGRGAERLFEHCAFEPRLKSLFIRLIDLSAQRAFAPLRLRARRLARGGSVGDRSGARRCQSGAVLRPARDRSADAPRERQGSRPRAEVMAMRAPPPSKVGSDRTPRFRRIFRL